MRIDRAFGELLAFLHEVALEDDDVLADRDEVLLFHAGLRVLDDDACACRERVPPKSTMPSILEISAASFGRRASNSSATRGRPPVMSLVLEVLRGVLAMSVPATILSPSLHDDVRAGRNRVVGATGFALVVHDDDLRMQIFLVLDDDHGFLAGGLVDFLLHRHAFDDVVELHLAGLLGENRHVVRIPLHEGLALLDLAAVRRRR